MSDQRALLAGICADPEEDTPRLAYADWLDENAGGLPKPKREMARARADLIRVQCELARLPPDEEDADTATRRIELEDREAALLKNAPRRRSWAKPLRPSAETGSSLVPDDAHFVRGFPLFATGSPGDFLAAGEAFFQFSPVHRVDCEQARPSSLERLFAAPWLSRVRRFSVDTYAGDSSEAVFAAPALANVEELELRNWAFHPAGAPVAGRGLRSLRRLSLRNFREVPSGPVALARLGEVLPPDARVREFALHSATYGPADLTDLAALPQFAELERLTLGRYGGARADSPLGTDGVYAMTAAPYWRALRSLRDADSFYSLTEPEAEALAAAPPAPHLRTLALSSGDLSRCLPALAAGPLLASVTSLEISRTAIGDGAAALANSPHLGRLLALNLVGTNLALKGIEALAGAPWAANLVRLDLRRCAVGTRGADALTARGAFPRLVRLDVRAALGIAGRTDRLRARFGDRVRF